jgi:hypothetical protein
MVTITSISPTANVHSACSIGSGWQSGISSCVFFTPKRAATRALSSTSPFGTRFSFNAAMVPASLTVTSAVAVASRRVVGLWVMSIICWGRVMTRPYVPLRPSRPCPPPSTISFPKIGSRL